MFRSVAHFGLIFVYCIRYALEFIFCIWMCSYSNTMCCKDRLFHWLVFAPLSKIGCPHTCGSVSELCSVLLIIRLHASTILEIIVLILQCCFSFSKLVVLGSLHFHVNFRISLSISTKRSYWDCDWCASGSIWRELSFWQYGGLWPTNMVVSVFKSFLIFLRNILQFLVY